jgi:hypothetical protein
MRFFISYARADGQDIATELEHRLLLQEHQVFLDIHGIPGGAQWEIELIKGIKQCQIMLILVTKASTKSEYVRKEFEEARKRGKRIVPIQVNNTKLSESRIG